MPITILAQSTSDNAPGGAVLTFAFPIILFAVIAMVLYYLLFSQAAPAGPGPADRAGQRRLPGRQRAGDGARRGGRGRAADGVRRRRRPSRLPSPLAPSGTSLADAADGGTSCDR